MGDPALIEWQPPLTAATKAESARTLPAYRGRVILYTSTANTDWTSWPVSPSFLPMMQEVLRLGIAGRLREHSARAGDVLEEFLPIGSTGLAVAIHTPEGTTETTHVQDHEDAGLLRWTDTDTSGVYRAVVGQLPQEHLFAVNVPTAGHAQQACESDLARTNADELRAAYPSWEFQIVTDPRGIVRSGSSAPGNVDRPARGLGTIVARDALLIMLGLLLVEVVLAWRFGHHRSGRNPESGAANAGRHDGILFALAAGLVVLFLGPLLLILVHTAWTGDFLGFVPDGFRRGVEAALGIPPPAPGEGSRWRLEFAPNLWSARADPWLLGLCAVAFTALVVAVYLREGSKVRVAAKLLLVTLRVCFVLLALIVLVPQVRLWFERQGWPDIAVIIDDSRSMSAMDRYQDPRVRAAADRLAQTAGLSNPQRLQLAQALVTHGQPDWLNALNARKLKVHVYHCSGTATRLGDITHGADGAETRALRAAVRNLRADDESSQLGGAVRQVLNDFRGSSLSAVVMLSDGVTTEGEDLVKASRYARQLGVPLFFVGLGDAHEVRDLQLHDLQVEDSVYVNDRLVFEARLSGHGYTDLAVPVTLREKGKDKVLATQLVKVDPHGKPVKVRLAHQPAEPGEKVYVLEVPVQPDEIQPAENNRIERTVFVREAKLIKVLYVEGYARYEYRFVKNLLERESAEDRRNKTIDLKVLLLDASEDYAREDKSALVEFPSKTELNQFDVVLLGDVDPRHPKIGAKRLAELADFVRERGGGLLAIAGPRFMPHAYKEEALQDVLPVETRGLAPVTAERTEGYRPELTPLGRYHPIFRFSPDEAENTAVWNRLAEIYWWSEGLRIKPAAEVLAVHPRLRGRDDVAARFQRAEGKDAENLGSKPDSESGPAEGRYPLIVQQFVGAGRCLFFGIDETWRWRYREGEMRFNQFWIQTVRYLSRSRLGRVELRLDRQTPYQRGEPIKVTVRFPDDTPPPAAGVEVKVMVERALRRASGQEGTESQVLVLSKLEGSRATYETVLTRTPEGDYRFWLSAPAVAGAAGESNPRAECRVLTPPGEMDRLRMNRQDMERAAEESQGRFYTLADAGGLLDDLPTGTRVALKSPQPPRLLWNHALVFAMALILLSVEWLVRKRVNLV